MKKIFLFLFILIGTTQIKGQTVPVGIASLEEYYRRMQLMGDLDSTISFTVRPLSPENLRNNNDVFDPDNSLQDDHWLNFNQSQKSKSKLFELQLMPISWKQQINSHHPYGWNDGAMIPAKGYQTLLSAGFFAKIGPLHIQLAPEFLHAANKGFETVGNRGFIDFPERFSDDTYTKTLWGQSSIRLNFGPASIGLSNENLWWGPGKRNSLLMSNNAQGFKHITLNTTKPISSPVGSFEAQFIGGKLEGSGLAPFDDTYPGNNEWRYLSGMNIVYQPKWLPGLFLGFTRNFYAYNDDIEKVGDYVPFLTPFQKVKTNDGDEFPRDQILSFYTRWLFPKARAEVYFEFGQNDNSHDFRDFIGAPEHSRAYLFGFSKLIPVKNKENEFIQVNAELTQLSQTIDRYLREAADWYMHGAVPQGYTHRGQTIAGSMDLGANIQSLDVSWVKGLKKIGLSFERYEHKPHYAPELFNGRSRRWVDFAFAGIGEWNYKNLLLSTKIQGIKSLNYQWRLKDYDSTMYYIPNNDLFNFHGELGIMFRF